MKKIVDYFGISLTILLSVLSVFTAYIISVSELQLISEQTTYSGEYPNGLIVTKSNSIVVDADIQNPNGNGLVIKADNVLVDEVFVHNVSGHGIIIESSKNVSIKNSVIYDTAKGTCYPSCSSGWSSAIKVRSADEQENLSENIVIENNTIFENYGEGIGIRGAHITIRKNYLRDNFSVNIYSNSSDVLIEGNYIYCSENTAFYRDGLPATGIAVAQENFGNWGGHAYNHTVINNIVNGCKNGFGYNGSDYGVYPTGFRDSIVSFNTFANTKRIPIRIDYENGNSNLIVHNNIGTMSEYSNFTGISYEGNVLQSSVSFKPRTNGEFSFILEDNLQATGSFFTQFDFCYNLRTEPVSVGAWEK